MWCCGAEAETEADGKAGKLFKSEGIKLINGQTIKEVDDEGYKYLGILE